VFTVYQMEIHRLKAERAAGAALSPEEECL
jgi:hypothetical protein